MFSGPIAIAAGLLAAPVLVAAGPAAAAEPASCATVRMAEPGWNDLTFTTAVAGVLFEALGYQPKSELIGLNVIYEGLKNGDLDVFLGYWDPAMISYYEPYKDSVDTVRQNLDGAKYTFAVPTYAYEAGVRDIADLHKFADQFDRKLYGIEPGSNQLMFDIVADPAFELAGWEVVESSEQGMLAEVGRMTQKKAFIVFQGWAPHPMNEMYDFQYLTGGDKYYGPDFGAATVSTQVRKGYVAECPNAGRLLQNLAFDIAFENRGIGYLINDGMSPEDAATTAIRGNPEHLDTWLAGVTTLDGGDGLAAVKQKLGL
jgi:glycine betaine/proline transport system substrate-binding protein